MEDKEKDGDPSKDKDKKDGYNNDDTEDDHNDDIEGDNNDDIEDKNNDADPSKEAIAFLVLLFLCTAWKRPVLLQSGYDYNQNLIDNIKNHNQIVVKESDNTAFITLHHNFVPEVEKGKKQRTKTKTKHRS